ncbi:PDR/VanB family oxidoreductase [Ornithinimicrobium humiphilum]|uniref:Ferredoxin-NADP reductase n=1 Tax=Ornithinimicrobium humiphilum TaxID=125288 RepID=A0A543KRQ9_9MICO|nr:PDR/VanB family oxidoreductase [Ornithinimicrobium humiphilum]TQM97765.1 ferredoxin-NADP reductase [Ornithinimicrobium humiphilum]
MNDWYAVRVVATREVADGVLELRLVRPDGQALPDWEPGAHLDVQTPAGVRQYSLCGDPADNTYTIAVLREETGRGGSRALHDLAAPGVELQVLGPRNHFPLVEDAEDYLLIAGGIGVTPIRAMADRLARTGARWRLHYGGRSRASMAYADELLDLGGDVVRLYPQDTDGLLDLGAILAEAGPGTVVYCCGPAPLLDAAAGAVAASPARELRVERFTGPTAPMPEPGGAPADDAVTPTSFVVELAASGGSVEVGPDRSILEAVRSAGVDVISSCEEGWCGTCETRVLAGVPLHRDEVLTPSEQASNEVMMICVGRSCSERLVLDL